ncbi:deoxyribose-phosphate aldolase [Leucobacter sp. CSA1]|uniref:Deoxyribose-phosphate aldolase n=1 Tax=Leucobacter chromiisoli TaxID=2796471 RepID=A0A934UUF4_9MICO|nr:deoxyribose-phosphate aldolase [Leucobacter chromiisoli]MBK0418371.1 deoxyribose-phosphate aldolase [Leucobacter chromiisoli]
MAPDPQLPESGELTRERFLAVADHTLLASDATRGSVREFLAGARDLGVARVCLNPSALPVEAGALEVVAVAGFPSGAHLAEVKAAEAGSAAAMGAAEIDMVVNLGLVRAGDWEAVAAEVRRVREACPGLVLKTILETAALTDDEIVGACRAAETGGADFVKTSTGYHPAGGASVHAVRLMAETVGGRLGVKASGGVRTAGFVRELWAAGATRFGVSGTAAILADWEGRVGAAAPTSDY